ncbi:MAG: hypothetical protein CM15mP23_08190 [Cryomorphaceae bacterium]|nr:MAG: hypothetical protein CM15mP23_08190 [Cryomorphaceae bacterium]
MIDAINRLQRLIDGRGESFPNLYARKTGSKNSSYTIPVVVHIIKNESHENWVDMDITC